MEVLILKKIFQIGPYRAYLKNQSNLDSIDCSGFIDCSAKKIQKFVRYFDSSLDFKAHMSGVIKSLRPDRKRSSKAKKLSVYRKVQRRQKKVRMFCNLIPLEYCN
jgi:hypothetical protein